MERTVSTPQKRNFIRGETAGSPVKTEVAAFPVSSYVSNNSWNAGGENETAQLLKSLVQFAPQLGSYLNTLNDKRVAADRTRGAADQMTGKSMESNPSEAYKAAYYQLKAEGDASDFAARFAELSERSEAMTIEEYDKEKTRLLGTMVTGAESPYYLNTLVPRLSQVVDETDRVYYKKQREATELDIRNNLTKVVNDTILAIPKDAENTGELLAPALQAQLDRAKALGKTTMTMQDTLVEVVGTEAVAQGRPELLDAFKVPYKNGSAYNSVLKPKIEDYITKAEESKWRRVQHDKTMFEYNQSQWQKGVYNQIYKGITDNFTDYAGLQKLQIIVDAAAAGNQENGFMLSNDAYKDLTNMIKNAIESGGAPELTNPQCFSRSMLAARQGASFNAIISQYGWGLNLNDRRNLVMICANEAASDSNPEKQAYKGMKNDLENSLRHQLTNVNPKTGEMYFRDGYLRADDAAVEFNMRVDAEEQEKGRYLTGKELLQVQRESMDYVNDQYKKRKEAEHKQVIPVPGNTNTKQPGMPAAGGVTKEQINGLLQGLGEEKKTKP